LRSDNSRANSENGNFPLIASLDIAKNEALDYPQLPEPEVYENIINDFKTSIAYLDGVAQNRYRPSKGAAICLAAKAYLSQPNPNYGEAELLLASVVENSASFNYDLIFTERENADQFEFNPDPLDPTVDLLTDAEYNANLVQDYGHVLGNSISEGFSEGVLDGSWSNNPALEINDEVIFSIAYDLVISNPTVDVFNTRFPTNGEIGDNGCIQ